MLTICREYLHVGNIGKDGFKLLLKENRNRFSDHLKGNGRDASASENVENGDIVYNVGDDFKYCRANRKQSQAFIVHKISKASLADFSIWI